MSLDWIKPRVWELLVVVMVLIPVALYDEIRSLRYELTESDDYFTVGNVYVADSIEGEDPVVVYERTVRQPFRGKWIAGVFNVQSEDGTMYGVCNNSGEVDYRPAVKLPKAGVTLSWFIEKDCKLKPGRYTLQTTWEIRLPEGVIKTVRFTSNIFTVRPAS